MDNLRKRADVKLVRSDKEDQLIKYITGPTFARQNIINIDLAAIKMHKITLASNKTVTVLVFVFLTCRNI